jgi:hypothetical protein
MDTTFLSYCLTLFLVIILIAYLHQTTNQTLKNSNNSNNSQNKKLNNSDKILIMNYNEILNKENQDNRLHKKKLMPIHPVGPVYNFHQHFNKYKNIPGTGYPTGIPEMGWRNLFLSNYSDNQVVEEDSFSGTPIRAFLDNLDNVKNLYREEY